MVWFLRGMEGGGVGNTLCLAGPSWLWDVESSKESVSYIGLVLLVVCWWAGHLGICESYVRKEHPKQTEHGNCPLVTGPREGTPGSDSIYTYQGPQALPWAQSRGPHTEGIAVVTQWSAVSASPPRALTARTQERKRVAPFFQMNQGSRCHWYAGRQIISLAPRAISRTMLSDPFGGATLQPTTAFVHLNKQAPLRREPQAQVDESVSWSRWVCKISGGSVDSPAEKLLSGPEGFQRLCCPPATRPVGAAISPAHRRQSGPRHPLNLDFSV